MNGETTIKIEGEAARVAVLYVTANEIEEKATRDLHDHYVFTEDLLTHPSKLREWVESVRNLAALADAVEETLDGAREITIPMAPAKFANGVDNALASLKESLAYSPADQLERRARVTRELDEFRHGFRNALCDEVPA